MANRAHYESVTTYVDFQTGETIETTHHKVSRLPTEPPYIKQYQHFMDDLAAISNLPRNAARVLTLLVSKIDYDGVVSLNASSRKRIAKACDISNGSLRNALSDLIKSDVLKRINPNEFEVNPNYFAKGKWRDIYLRRQAYEMHIRYNSDGTREVSTNGVPEE